MALFYFDHYDGEMLLDSDGTELETLMLPGLLPQHLCLKWRNAS